jgi:hypothetical protein
MKTALLTRHKQPPCLKKFTKQDSQLSLTSLAGHAVGAPLWGDLQGLDEDLGAAPPVVHAAPPPW